jgi:DNA repair protein RecO (recombination protein O)
MDWADEGLLLSARPHGESAAIIEVLTAVRGRHLGVVRGGAGRKLAPVLQPGAQLALVWRARLDQHIGAFTVEPVRSRAGLVLADPDRLAGLAALCALAAFALPEREPQPRLYPMTVDLADGIAGGGDWFGPYLRWERALLEEVGFGLDLSACAVTGATRGLAHVSPRTGRAVTAEAGAPWADRLLPLPAALLAEVPADRAAMAAGLRTTGHFLAGVLAPALGDRPLPAARLRLAARFGG